MNNQIPQRNGNNKPAKAQLCKKKSPLEFIGENFVSMLNENGKIKPEKMLKFTNAVKSEKKAN